MLQKKAIYNEPQPLPYATSHPSLVNTHSPEHISVTNKRHTRSKTQSPFKKHRAPKQIPQLKANKRYELSAISCRKLPVYLSVPSFPLPNHSQLVPSTQIIYPFAVFPSYRIRVYIQPGCRRPPAAKRAKSPRKMCLFICICRNFDVFVTSISVRKRALAS